MVYHDIRAHSRAQNRIIQHAGHISETMDPTMGAVAGVSDRYIQIWIKEYVLCVTESFEGDRIKEMPCTGALHLFIRNSIDRMIVNGLT